jgi:hypothetical protein
MLPKSQAWCVDGDSKFVIQIRRPKYWRIEVPNKTDEEKSRVEELKKVLGEILLFEKTPCPFQRDFTVELPGAPKTPVKKRPWRPPERSNEATPPLPDARWAEGYFIPEVTEKRSSSSSPVRTSTPAAQRRNSANDFAPQSPASRSEVVVLFPGVQDEEFDTSSTRSISPEPESSEEPLLAGPFPEQQTVEPDTTAEVPEPSLLDPSEVDAFFGDSRGLGEDIDTFSDATDDTNITPRNKFQPSYQPLVLGPEKHERPQAIQNCSRSITAPPILSLVTSPPSKHRTSPSLRCSTIVESNSEFSSSVDSFHSVQSWHSPLAPPSPPASGPPSPSETYPYPHNNIILPKRHHHTREQSEVTVTPETPRVWDIHSTPRAETGSRAASPPPKTPTLVNDTSEKSDEEQFEVVTPPTTRTGLRHRATTSNNSRRRELSPLPAAVNLFSPSRRRSRRLQTARHLPTAIIQKTCEILLSPPSHLFHLMLNIASKIAAGEWRGVLSSHGDVVHWNFEDEYGGEGWHEDDYGMSLTKAPSESKASSTGGSGGSWEVD